ncbi:virulence factor SrfB [Candidatus Pantoea deserta]|uniref:Virulence factor SrfB n=1 Tax=Candidatus Pantoea deserta TaxID=1869313 RepID=A0A3N4PLN9_9GAMM|nr:virulence factor SrfB [Pantoea deserta]RPE04650.1 virulence factor SrfB [Pantoea deserta]
MMVDLSDAQAGVTLIQNSGIQLLDAGVSLAAFNSHSGRFARQTANGPLLRLDYQAASAKYQLTHPQSGATEIVKPESQFTAEASLMMLQNQWLPLPLLRVQAQRTASVGPFNWARVQFNRLPTANALCHDVQVTLAFDTQTDPEGREMPGLAPTSADVRNGTRFRLAWRNHELAEFLDQTWIDGWLREIFILKTEQLGYSDEAKAHALKYFDYQAHYLNLLEIVGEQLPGLQVQLAGETPAASAIDVDLVLDVGNSHTAGILIEDHGLKNDGLRQCAALQIRSLSEPTWVNEPLFSSRIEFSEAQFGKPCYSAESGRDDAFVWPSLVRTGAEACQLAIARSGTKGPSGLSSARRYLWDTAPADTPWYFSHAEDAPRSEKPAVAMPLMRLVNSEGVLLASLPEEARMPVFSPRYSRSALMTLMLSELLAQALMQMNSFASRQQMGQSHTGRQLRSIILTLPSAMPIQEQKLFRQRMEEAVAIVWKARGWHPLDALFDYAEAGKQSKVPLPAIHIDWDEATCGQLVWLYNETRRRYDGRVDLLLRTLARPDRLPKAEDERGQRLRIASLDIGGGTTDMAIVEYRCGHAVGGQQEIKPTLLFREGFKVAGDDMLCDVIQQLILPAIDAQLHRCGIAASRPLMTQLFGDAPGAERDGAMQQHITLQLLIPLAQAVLARWQNSAADPRHEVLESSFASLLPSPPSAAVIAWVQERVARAAPESSQAFDLLATPLHVDFAALNDALIAGHFSVTPALRALCEAVAYHHCDLLLVAGRPAALPGIQALLRALQPVPASRIIYLNDYQVALECPLSRQGALTNAKSTAAIGAMLYRLATQLRLTGFHFNAAEIRPYSTLRFFGPLNHDGQLQEEHVWYGPADLDETSAPLNPALMFPVRGTTRLGFRQLANASWPASALYQLSIKDSELARQVAAGKTLRVSLQRDPQSGAFSLASAQMQDGSAVTPQQLLLTLNTLGGAADEYWIDSGKLYQ